MYDVPSYVPAGTKGRLSDCQQPHYFDHEQRQPNSEQLRFLSLLAADDRSTLHILGNDTSMIEAIFSH
jgi:hypothetical protein